MRIHYKYTEYTEYIYSLYFTVKYPWLNVHVADIVFNPGKFIIENDVDNYITFYYGF